jgi:NAD(P)-dependent dehydrogenase (short-subunit alcohol dehydrogenase family)
MMKGRGMTTIALVTGANRGIGLAVARQLADRGATVLLGSRDEARGHAAADQLRRHGLEAEALALDVDDDDSVEAAAERVALQHGHLDVLVNNAGILPEATATDRRQPVDVDLFRRTFDTNLFGAVRVLQHFVPLVEKAPAGRIVNVSTTMGSLSEQLNPESPYFGLVVPGYQASKAALNSVTIALAKTLPESIKVTSVCPGWVQTDLGGPDNRAAAPLTADEAARIVVAAASLPDDAPTGQFLDAHGTVAW